MPRRSVPTGVDKQAGIQDNLRIRFRDGTGVLASKNEADNLRFDEFTSTGGLEGWTLDNPPEEYAFGVYIKGPNSIRETKQAEITFENPVWDQKDLLVDGAPPPNAAHRVSVAPFALPPVLELVAAEQVGFTAGWWAVTDAFGVGKPGKNLLTQCAPLAAIELGQNQGIQVPMRDSIPEGCTYISLGINGPFLNEIAALNTTVIWRQVDIPTYPRWPVVYPLRGPLIARKRLSFDVNTTAGGGGERKTKRKHKRPAGSRKKKKR